MVRGFGGARRRVGPGEGVAAAGEALGPVAVGGGRWLVAGRAGLGGGQRGGSSSPRGVWGVAGGRGSGGGELFAWFHVTVLTIFITSN